MDASIEIMDRAGVGIALDWAEREGWQPGLGDAGPFFAADPEGHFRSVAGDRTLATLSVVRGSPRVAFVGLYIVDPGLRGRGVGRHLWDEAIARFDGVTLGLDAVPEQVETYASAGFEPAYGNARYSARSLPASDGAETLPAEQVAFEALAAFDAAHFFGPRPGFLRGWIAGDGRDALVTVDRGEITGFAASRRTSAGHRIGPVFADHPALARALILDLARRAGGPVAIDLPQPNRAALDLVGSLGMERSFETWRMYRGEAPDLPLGSIYGVTSLELG